MVTATTALVAPPRGLPRRQAMLLAALTRHPSLTRRGYQVLAGIGHRTAQRDLAELTAEGLLVRLGRARAARYALPPPS